MDKEKLAKLIQEITGITVDKNTSDEESITIMRDYSKTDHKNSWRDADVEQHWDSVADIYIKENERVSKAHNQRFIESVQHLDLSDDEQVLNISSRDCEANDYISRENPNVSVINTEISSGLMAVAKKIRPIAEQIKIKTYSPFYFRQVE